MITIVSTGHLIGLEDIVIGETSVHTTSAVVMNQAELYKIDKDAFYSTLKQTQTWQELVKKSRENVTAYHKSIKLMKQSKSHILDGLKSQDKEGLMAGH